MSTSGGGIVNGLLYVIVVGLALLAAGRLQGTDRPERPGPRELRSVVVIWLVVAVPSLLEFAVPGLFTALSRNPPLVREGQVWRVLTSVVVQDGGIAGTVFNLAILAFVLLLAVRVWTAPLVVALMIGAQLVFGIVAIFVSNEVGGGNSAATFGLAATIVGVAGRRLRGRPTLVLVAVTALIALVLGLLRDAHGIPILVGLGLGAALAARARLPRTR